jgi:hypothetical protein
VFLFFFFLFHDLDLDLGLPLLWLWLKNLIVLVVFVLVISNTRSKKHGPLGVLTYEESLTIVGYILDMKNCGLSITL